MRWIEMFSEWWNGAKDERRVKLDEYARRYAHKVIPPRYRWYSTSLDHMIRISVSESYICTDCGAHIMRTPSVDGVQIHEDWHWRVDRVAGS